MYPAVPLINGIAYSWAQVRLSVAGTDISGVEKVTYAESQTMDPVYGAGDRPVDIGMGNIEYSGTLTLHVSEAQKLVAASPSGRLQDLPFFSVQVSFQNGLSIVVHTLQLCKFKNNGVDISQGDVNTTVDLDLFISNIKWK